MLKELLILSLITIVPLVELRLSIPVGILAGSIILPYGITLSGLGLNPVIVLLVAVIVNILLGMMLFTFLNIFDERLKRTKIAGPYIRILDRSQRKISKYVDRYGKWGLLLFISLPVPGSGVYTGSVGAFIVGMRKKDFYLANAIGVSIAGIIVTLITLFGRNVL